MTSQVVIHRAGPGLSIQDFGRPNLIAQGLSCGGAADRLALLEAAALLTLPAAIAAIEMATAGGEFAVSAPARFALTGAPMRAAIDDKPLRWNASHTLLPGQRLSIGAAISGVYGYLTFAGGIETPPWQNSRSAHLAAGIGARLKSGDQLPIGPDPAADTAACLLPEDDRFGGGAVRLMPGPQTSLFPPPTLQRFLGTTFARGAEANRQGVKLDHDGEPFGTTRAAALVSDFIQPGDVQMTGDGIPYVLLSESQTIGGYPRIGTVIRADLPRVAQTPAGAPLHFTEVSVEEADRLYRPDEAILAKLRSTVQPLIRDPETIHDLLTYQLISGITSGDDLERSEDA